MTAREMRAQQVFDYAVEHPDGFTVDVATTDLGFLHHQQTRKAIHDVRREMADDSIVLTCDPQGRGDQWLYRLVGTPDALEDWMRTRHDDTLSRLRTMLAMESTMVNASDGRSIEGRKARLIHRTINRLVEDMQDLEV